MEKVNINEIKVVNLYIMNHVQQSYYEYWWFLYLKKKNEKDDLQFGKCLLLI